MDLQQFKKRINKVEDLGEEPVFYGKVSLTEIKEVESALNIHLDKEITAYLREFGGGGVPDLLNTNGIIPENPLSDDLYTLYGATIYAREEYTLPPNYVVIDAEFSEKCWVLDCTNPEKNGIFFYNCIDQKIETKFYDSFQEYLITGWEMYIEDEEE